MSRAAGQPDSQSIHPSTIRCTRGIAALLTLTTPRPPRTVLPSMRFSGKMGMIAAGNVMLRRWCSHSKSENRRHTLISLRGRCGSVVVVMMLYLVCLLRPDPKVVGLVTTMRTAVGGTSGSPSTPTSAAVP